MVPDNGTHCAKLYNGTPSDLMVLAYNYTYFILIVNVDKIIIDYGQGYHIVCV